MTLGSLDGSLKQNGAGHNHLLTNPSAAKIGEFNAYHKPMANKYIACFASTLEHKDQNVNGTQAKFGIYFDKLLAMLNSIECTGTIRINHLLMHTLRPVMQPMHMN